MKAADYICDYCGNDDQLTIEMSEDFPQYIPCLVCGKDLRRVFSPAYTICHQGKAGNAKNGYTSNPTKIKKT